MKRSEGSCRERNPCGGRAGNKLSCQGVESTKGATIIYLTTLGKGREKVNYAPTRPIYIQALEQGPVLQISEWLLNMPVNNL